MSPPHPPNLFVVALLLQQQQSEDKARMKRHRFPLRGDHKLLTPDKQTLSGVKLCEQVGLGGMASSPGHLRDLSIYETAMGSTRQCSAMSPTRRLRFEDETEVEAESRYLERQRRQTGTVGTGVLAPKPDLNMIIKGTSLREEEHIDRPHRPATVVVVGQTCGTVSGITFHPRPPQSLTNDKVPTLTRHRFNLRTEPIRETYIGLVSPREAPLERAVVGSGFHMPVRRRADLAQLNETVLTVHPATPSTDLPINPYDPCMAKPVQAVVKDLPIFRHSPSSLPLPFTSVKMPQRDRINDSKTGQSLNKKAEKCERWAAAKPHTELQVGSELEGTYLPPGEGGSETTVDSQAPSTSGSVEDQVRQPIRASLACAQPFTPAYKDEPSRLSLRHLFSTVRLGRTRTSSLNRLGSNTFSNPAPSGTIKSSGQLKKSASVQSLYVQGSPVLPLKQSSTGLSFQCEQKKRDRSVDYRPAVEQSLSRCLSVEDVGVPCYLHPVGRLLKVCFDGTFLLELNRPMGQTYGFIISRGRGRPDSGVYVEDMVDNRTEKLYAGLLSVGDEILEVNEEEVASLSLDQVSRLLIQKPCNIIRVLRHQK